MRVRTVYKRKNNAGGGCGGSHIDDPFLSYIKGHKELSEAAWDAMSLHNEIDDFALHLFPVGARKNFSLQHPDKKIKDDLTLYFVKTAYGLSDGLYGNLHELAWFLREVGRHLLIEGEAFHAIDWSDKKIEDSLYTLPLRFRYLRTSTMRVKRRHGRIIGFSQKYSWIGTLLNQRSYGRHGWEKSRKVEFDVSDVFYTRYPFGRRSPAKRAMRYVRKVFDSWDFAMYRSKGAAHPEMHEIRVEQARFRPYNEENAKRELARGKISKIFDYLYKGKMTQFYDVYQVVHFRKRLNDFRNYLIQQFNTQVLNVLAEKNGFKEAPKVGLSGLMTNQEIEKIHEMFKRKEVTLKQFIDLLRV